MCLQRQGGGLKEGRPVSFMVPTMVWDGVDGVKIIIFSPTRAELLNRSAVCSIRDFISASTHASLAHRYML